MLGAYHGDEFWSRVAKGLYGASGIIGRRLLGWESCVSRLLAEYDHIEATRGLLTMLAPYGDTGREFLLRLTAKLRFCEDIGATEKRQLGGQ